MQTLITVKSYYSLLEGVNSPAQLAARAAAIGCTSLALSDHHMLTGSVEFALACRKYGIRPIFGLEVDVKDPPVTLNLETLPRITLLAENESGWSNLCRISSIVNLEDNKALTFQQIASHLQGLIGFSGGTYGIINQFHRIGFSSQIPQLVNRIGAIFKDKFFFRITGNPHLRAEERLLSQHFAQISIRQVFVPDVVFIDQEDHTLQRLVCAIRSNIPAKETTESHGYAKFFSFPPLEELKSNEVEFSEAFDNSSVISDRCQFQMPFGIIRFPKIQLPSGLTVDQVLRTKAYDGAKSIYGRISGEIQQRLDYELETIKNLGYDPIFLIMEEILSFARREGILFSSRGSAASSLVAHCLGITSPDPIRLSLYFERFLNPARSTPPDIDTDIDSNRRDEIIQHCFSTFGQDRVAMVATINRFRPRSAVGDAAKALGFLPAEARALAADLPHHFFSGRSAGESDDSEEKFFSELASRHPDEHHRELFTLVRRLLGIPRHLSVHPGGMVITPGIMTDLVPVMLSGGKGVQISQFDLEALAYLGLVKIDLLGIRGLTVSSDVAKAIHSWRRAEFRSPSKVIEAIPLNDFQTGDIVANGKTIGCFQIESPGMRATLKSIHARTPDDIMAALALYRPGPLRGGLRDAFIRRHNLEEEVSQLHPSLTRLLTDTYGVILYQEQVLRIAHEIGGLTLAESDTLRRAMSHFDPGKQMQLLKDKFTRGASDLHQVPLEISEQIWEMMAAFAGYGFPKAHAASYAQVAWNSAWCKSHYPAEFMAAVLANWGGYYSQRVYLMEARRLGFRPKPPHINFSDNECSVVYPEGTPQLYLGLDQVKDLTKRTIESIKRNRPFISVDDFLIRANPRKSEAANLIRCGALSGFGTIPDLLVMLDSSSRKFGQPSLFESYSPLKLDEWSIWERVEAQMEILGIGVDAHPLDLYADRLSTFQTLTTAEALEQIGKQIFVAGVRQSYRRSRTSSGEMIAFLTLEDFEGTLDVILFSRVYRTTRKEIFTENRPLVVEGVIELDPGRGEPFLRADKIYLIN